MRLMATCLALAGFCSALSVPKQQLLRTEKGDPWTDPQAGIREVKGDITDLIADFVHNNISEATLEYVFIRIFMAGALQDNILGEGGNCRNITNMKIGPYPNTTTEVIQSLQKIQLALNVLSQDLINKAAKDVVRTDFCVNVLAPFWAVSCFEGGGFARYLNGSFEPPARWICKQYRYNPGAVDVDRSARTVEVAGLFEIDAQSDL
ncbi:hypothetical protein LTR10_010702 [Elasticomyces elasticus]|nr:hypothetical protein LTR10_010702 [Elasticomyces elasticus]KAK4968308.1 hypothetical protein LTR42_009591 [Elasticomyces elasticus]